MTPIGSQITWSKPRPLLLSGYLFSLMLGTRPPGIKTLSLKKNRELGGSLNCLYCYSSSFSFFIFFCIFACYDAMCEPVDEDVRTINGFVNDNFTG